MRSFFGGMCLVALIAGTAIGQAAAQDFEDLVEDALRRAPGGGTAQPDTAVPDRLRVQPAPEPRVERRIRIIPEPGAAAPQEVIIQPAPDAAEPPPPRRVIIETPPAGADTASPQRQAPAGDDLPPEVAEPGPTQPETDGLSEDPGLAPAPDGPRPYTPPRRSPAESETAGEPAGSPAQATPDQATGGSGDLAPPAAEAGGADQAIGETPTEPQPTLRNLAAFNVAEVNAATFVAGTDETRGPSAVVLKAQILLDRAGASPGVIDGVFGGNVAKAVAAVETVLGLPVDGRLDAEVWNALGGDRAADVLVPYTITEEDARYPFLPSVPPDYAQQAQLPELGFTSPEEMFGERFHMDVKLLTALNAGVDMRQAGNTIIVAAIEGQPVTGKISRIEADKARRQVRAYDAQNRLVVAYPATIGSADNPSPSGDHIVNTIAPDPIYYYNPENFVQGENRTKLELPPGPNNPVGTMWIDLSEPSYGIHGTPEPSKIDKTGSHGCIRLTNWDAEELATLVEKGVVVSFVE